MGFSYPHNGHLTNPQDPKIKQLLHARSAFSMLKSTPQILQIIKSPLKDYSC